MIEALSRMIGGRVVLIVLALPEPPKKATKFELRHRFSLKSLGVNLALPTAMTHIGTIELRPNDLASPRTSRRTDEFIQNSNLNLLSRQARRLIHTYLTKRRVT